EPVSKGQRLAAYVRTLRKELLWLARATGHPHPALIRADQFEVLDGRFGSASAQEVFGYQSGWGLPPAAEREALSSWVSGAWPQQPAKPATSAL
ncbi:MAG: FMN-binding glutamate synthase family protein, partial [Planctomycetota bacterium]